MRRYPSISAPHNRRPRGHGGGIGREELASSLSSQLPAASYFASVAVGHSQQIRRFTPGGVGRGRGALPASGGIAGASSGPLGGGSGAARSALGHLISPAAGSNTPSGPAGQRTGGNAVYSLANFAARKQVVPLVAKGQGMITPTETPNSAASTPSVKQITVAPNATGGGNAVSSPTPGPADKDKGDDSTVFADLGIRTASDIKPLTVHAARREHHHRVGDSAQGNATVGSAPSNTPSANALRVSGQSLLKSLARRSQQQSSCKDSAAAPGAMTHGHPQMTGTSSSGASGLEEGSAVPATSQQHNNEAAVMAHVALVRAMLKECHDRKVVRWDKLPPAIQALPAFHRRAAFSRHMHAAESEGATRENDATAAAMFQSDVAGVRRVLPPLLCTGDTGCGKSIIVPLVLTDLHWRGVVVGLARYLAAYMTRHRRVIEASVAAAASRAGAKSTADGDGRGGEDDGSSSSGPQDTEAMSLVDTDVVPQYIRDDPLYSAPADGGKYSAMNGGGGGIPASFIPCFDAEAPTEAFLDAFQLQSRWRLYVSQPTRLAAKSLATFLNAALSEATSPQVFGLKATTNDADVGDSASALPRSSLLLPLGFRVGYATALDKCINDSSCEIVFGTVGYLLNKFTTQQKQQQQMAQPPPQPLHGGIAAKQQQQSSAKAAATELRRPPSAMGAMAQQVIKVLSSSSSSKNSGNSSGSSSNAADVADADAAEFNVLSCSSTPNTFASATAAASSSSSEKPTASTEKEDAAVAAMIAGQRRSEQLHDAALPFALILDEAHRRDLQSDLLMTWAREWHCQGASAASLQQHQQQQGSASPTSSTPSSSLLLASKRRLFIMSASIDYGMFDAYFYGNSNADGIQSAVAAVPSGDGEEVSGRTVVARGGGSGNSTARAAFDLAAVDDEGEAVAEQQGLQRQPLFPRELGIGKGVDEMVAGTLRQVEAQKNPPKVAAPPPSAQLLPKRRPFVRTVAYGDALLEISKLIEAGRFVQSTPAKVDAAAAANTVVVAFDEENSRGDDAVAVSRLASSVLSRASASALYDLYTACFQQVDAGTNPVAARQVQRLRSHDKTLVDPIEAAAKVAVQCVAANQNVVVFVAGYSELVKFTMAVARLKGIAPSAINLSQREDTFAAEEGVDGAAASQQQQSAGPVLSYVHRAAEGKSSSSFSSASSVAAPFVVDLVALHATAIGEASAQLGASKAKAKIIVTTNVAESSITIPDVALVINSGLERAMATAEGGDNRLVTRLASKSSFIQREGRTGRTCDGVVLHLLRKHVFDALPEHSLPQWQEAGETEQLLLTAKLLFPPAKKALCTLSLPFGSSSSTAPTAHSHPLIPTFTLSSLCRKLPMPITDPSVLLPHAVALSDAGILTDPEASRSNTSSTINDINAPSSSAACTAKTNTPSGGCAKNANNNSLIVGGSSCSTDAAALAWRLLDEAALTFKGRFIASLPLPSPLALLVYYGFMYGCLDAALLMACGMHANITFVSPSAVIAQGALEHGLRQRFRLAEQTYRESVAQQQQHQQNAAAAPPPPPPSDPWLVFSLVEQWYGTAHADKLDFTRQHVVSMRAMLAADESIAMCCARLLDVLRPLYEGLGASDQHSKGRLRYALKRLQQVRKHALVNAVVLRSHRYSKRQNNNSNNNAAFFAAPSLPKCAVPASDDRSISVYDRLRAAFINAFQQNILIGSTSGGSSAADGSSPSGRPASDAEVLANALANNMNTHHDDGEVGGRSSNNSIRPIEAALSVRLQAGYRPLPSAYLANYDHEDVVVGMNRMFANSSLVAFKGVKLLPHRAVLMVQMRDTSDVSESRGYNEEGDGQHVALPHPRGGEGGLGVGDKHSEEGGAEDFAFNFDTKPIKMPPMIPSPSPSTTTTADAKKNSKTTNAAAAPVSSSGGLSAAPFPLWLLNALPPSLREARMPLEVRKSLAGNYYSSADTDAAALFGSVDEEDALIDSLTRFSELSAEDASLSSPSSTATAHGSNSSSKAAEQLVRFGGSLVRDEATGVAVRFELSSQLLMADKAATADDDGAAINTTNAKHNSSSATSASASHRNSIDLLQASALGFADWAPSESVLAEATAYIKAISTAKEAANGGGDTTSLVGGADGNGSSSSSLALAGAAEPWHIGDKARRADARVSNIFLSLGRVAVPNAVQWVAHMSPKAVVGPLVRRQTVLAQERAAQTAKISLMVGGGGKDGKEESNKLGHAEEASADFLNRVTCPVCCESIPASAKALHITRPSHLRNLQRLVGLGAPLTSVGRVVGNAVATVDEALVRSTAGSLKAASSDLGGDTAAIGGTSFSTQHKRLLVDLVTSVPSQHASIAAAEASGGAASSASSPSPFARLRDLAAVEDIPRPIPATLTSRSLASMLTCAPTTPTLPPSAPAHHPSSSSSACMSSAAAVAFSTSLVVRPSGSVASVGAWVVDPCRRSDAFLLLQSAVVEDGIAAEALKAPRNPLMLLFNAHHTKIYGFCVVGKYSVSFADAPLDASVVQLLLEIRQGMVRAATLFEAADSPANTNVNNSNSTTTTSSPLSSPSGSSSLPTLAVGGSAIAKLQETLVKGLGANAAAPTCHTAHQQAPPSDDEARHWCPLHVPCTAKTCERVRQLKDEHERSLQSRRGEGSSSPSSHAAPPSARSSPVGWTPTNPIEVVVSNTIIALLHEAQLTRRPRQSMTHFTQRLLHNLSLAAGAMGITSKRRLVDVEVESRKRIQPPPPPPPPPATKKKKAARATTKKSRRSAEGVMVEEPASVEGHEAAEPTYVSEMVEVEVSVETGSGIRLLEAYLKLRGAPSIEHVLTYCGCILTTSRWDATFSVPSALCTQVPSPMLMEAIQKGSSNDTKQH